MITLTELREKLHYDPVTGHFTWLKCGCSRNLVGKRAGGRNAKGYRVIRFGGGKSIYEHRLAWLYMKGKWPPDQVDHENRIRDDNRWKNLRLATNGQNQQNRANMKALPGAYRTDNPHRPWRGLITANKKRHHLGYFQTELEAHEAYRKAKRDLHSHGRQD